MNDGEMLKVSTYANGVKQVMVERDDHLLTPEEIKKHRQEVHSAMKAELTTRAEHKCISRKQRSQANNITDCKWVLKWKRDQEAQSVWSGANNY